MTVMLVGLFHIKLLNLLSNRDPSRMRISTIEERANKYSIYFSGTKPAAVKSRREPLPLRMGMDSKENK